MDAGLALALVRATYEQRHEVAIIVGQVRKFGAALSLAKEMAKS